MTRTPESYESIGGGRGGFRAALRRVFGDAENPLTWAITVGRVWGVRVRVHLFFVVYALAVLLFSISRDAMGIGYTALAMGTLFGLVLLHEFGHVAACRWVGGESDEVMLWPLGGLAECDVPSSWRAHLATALGGPAVNAALFPLTCAALWAAGLGGTILFNPVRPGLTLGELGSWQEVALWWAHYLNIVLLGFNLLVPMLPLDGGRALHALLWARSSRREALSVSVSVGMGAAIALGLFGLVANESTLVGVALFGGLTCWTERRRLTAPDALAGEGYGLSALDEEEERDRGPGRRELRRRERDAAEQAQVDRILAKIGERGMESLTRSERRVLERATRRKRRG